MLWPESMDFERSGIWKSTEVGSGLAREKYLRGDELRTVREGSFILRGQAGGIYIRTVQQN